MFILKDTKPGKPLLLHDEPIYLQDKIVGKTTSGNYSFNFKKNIAFGYIDNSINYTNFSGVEAYNFNGNIMWVRFRYEPDPANAGTIDKILYRS